MQVKASICAETPRPIYSHFFKWNIGISICLDCWNHRLGVVGRDRFKWLQLGEIEDAQLVAYQRGREIFRIERRPYAIRLITGAALGYEIHDQTTTELERLRERRPEFYGYELDAATLPPGTKIQLEDASGNPYPGSQRTVRVLGSGKLGWSIVLPTLPFLAAVSVASFRRRRFARLPREME